MKKGDFLWSAYRITEKQKAGKARNIKEKQLKNSRSTVSRQLVAHLSSQRDKQLSANKDVYTKPRNTYIPGAFVMRLCSLERKNDRGNSENFRGNFAFTDNVRDFTKR